MRRIFRVQAHFDRVSVAVHRVLREWQWLPGSDAQLPFDQIQACDHFRHRMLDLQAGIDLHEMEITVWPDDELDRAGVDVIDRMRGSNRSLAHARTQFGREKRRGRFLNHLLIPALRRTFAFAQMDDVAVRIAEDLEFDMPRMCDVTLQQYTIAAERILRFALAGFQCGGELVDRTHDAHALAAAAVRGLDHQRIADTVRFCLQQRSVLCLAGIARNDWHAVRCHQFLGAGLAAHLAHRCGAGADEDQPGCRDRCGEIGVLR